MYHGIPSFEILVINKDFIKYLWLNDSSTVVISNVFDIKNNGYEVIRDYRF